MICKLIYYNDQWIQATTDLFEHCCVGSCLFDPHVFVKVITDDVRNIHFISFHSKVLPGKTETLENVAFIKVLIHVYSHTQDPDYILLFIHFFICKHFICILPIYYSIS